MRWKDINFTTSTWRIEETKNGEEQTVHLPSQAMELLKERKLASDSP